MKRFNLAVRTSVSITALALALGGAAHAQDAEPEAEDSEFLGTITLGESKREVQTDTATPVTTIDRAEIRDRQATTIAELIDSVPGVSLVNGSTPGGSGINIRGFGANGTFGTDQLVAVFIDGATSGSEEIYRLGTQLFTDPYLYRSVQVQRGTVGSFEYGAGIVGGIVLLETVDASDITGGEIGFKWAQTLGYASNGEGFSTSTTLAWQPTADLEFLANYSYREQDNQDDGNGDEIGNSAFELPSFLLKGRYQFGADRAHSIEASFNRTESSDRDVPLDSFITAADFFGSVDRDTTSETAALIYNFSPSNNDLIDLEVALTYANQEFDQTFIEGSTDATGFFLGVIRGLGNADHQYETTKLTVKNTSFFEVGSMAFDTRYGFEIQERDRLDADSAPGGTDDRYAFFAVGDVEIIPNLTFSPGIRYENSSIEGLIADPSVPGGPFGPPPGTPEVPVSYENDALMGGASLRYAFDSGFAVFTSWARTENLPILDDLENSTFILQPQVATTFEAGASYDATGIFSDFDVVALKVNFFDTELDDVTSYSGIQTININGIEIEGSYATRGGFYIDVNANIVDGESESVPNNQTGVVTVADWTRTPQDSLRLTVGQRLGQLFGSVDTDLSAEIVHIAESDLVTPIRGDAATLLNLRATLEPTTGFLEGTQFRLSIENAGNERYQPVLATRNAVGTNFKISVSRVFF